MRTLLTEWGHITNDTHCFWFCLTHTRFPAGTRRNNNVFTTSTRRRRRVDVVKTLSLRHYCVMCPLGLCPPVSSLFWDDHNHPCVTIVARLMPWLNNITPQHRCARTWEHAPIIFNSWRKRVISGQRHKCIPSDSLLWNRTEPNERKTKWHIYLGSVVLACQLCLIFITMLNTIEIMENTVGCCGKRLTEAQTQRPPFCRQHFLMRSLK